MTFPNYDAIKGWFDLQLWKPEMVAKAVELKVITADQYKAITSSDYPVSRATSSSVTNT